MPIKMDVKGNFGNALAAAVDKKGVSLRELAELLDVTYEHLRKLIRSEALPSSYLLRDVCKHLGLNLADMEEAVIRDKMAKQYSAGALSKVMKRNPRMARLEPLVPLLSDAEYETVLAMIRGLVRPHQK